MSGYARRVRYWAANRLWHLRVNAARKLLAPGPRTWEALDRLRVPGFGIDLIRIDFPPDLALRDAWQGAYQNLAPLLDEGQDRQLALLDACLRHSPDLAAWPASPEECRPELPWRDNPFLTLLDMATLYGFLREIRPPHYVEIGSGMSTRVAAAARRSGGLSMSILSIDPEPRVEIEALCDRGLRHRLETAVESVLAAVKPGTVLFFDGSHRSFPGSDVTVFFLNILPRLPAGVFVHVHDIFLPNDYPAHFAARYWSEQYLLAAWLLGGSRRIHLLLPCARLFECASARTLLDARVPTELRESAFVGGSSSFWFETK